MNSYSLAHLADQTLLQGLRTLVAKDRTTTAALLAHLAELEARGLYRQAAHPSMHSYCVHVLHLSEYAAHKRIRAARIACDFPALFEALADGRLHLSAVLLLGTHLTPETVDELIAAATHKTYAEIEQLLANRRPRPDVPTRIEAIAPSPSRVPETGSGLGATLAIATLSTTAPACPETEQLAARPVEATVPRPRITPLAPERFALQLTMDQVMHEKLRYAQDLLSHKIPSGDVVQVLGLALDVLIAKLEKIKFAATDRPRAARGSAADGRYIPTHVKRAVWERDQGRCTFTNEQAERCPSRRLLEYDHVQEFARGGKATVQGIRLRCAAHNQFEAERTYGTEFMRRKREEARRAAEVRGAT